MTRSFAAATTPRTTPKSGMIAFMGILLVLALLVLLNFRFFITSGPSMEPTYTDGTWVLAVKVHAPLQPGDLVFLRYKNAYCLKRVAFTAGQDVSKEGYEGYWGSNTVPEGYVFVLGDNPDESLDSRDPIFGLVSVSDIWGKPLNQRQKGELP